MKISKRLWVENSIRFNKIQRLQMRLQNKCRKHLYFVCTSYNDHLLFDIIESQYLTHRYKGCYLIGVAKSKESAVNYAAALVNEIYNLKTINLDMIKT